MKRKIAGICLLAVFCVFIFHAGNLYASGGGVLYAKAIKAIKEKQYDYAFMQFRAIVRDYPGTKYTQRAMFGTGEYFYNSNMHYEAIEAFSDYIRRYPDSDAGIFARAYLLNIAETIARPTEEDKAMVDGMKKEFFSKPVFLLFSEYKEFSYKSVFGNSFEIRYYLDIIEVYRNGQIFIKIAQ
ncbi:MAG: outer membrane protein assembly factor BamD [Candidatus Omnitrophota bacterium]